MQEGEESLYSLHRNPFVGRSEGNVEGFQQERIERAKEIMGSIESQMKMDKIPENFGK